jgi:hypothetical protein
MGAAIELSLTVKPASAEAAVASTMRARSIRRLKRSTSTPTDDRLSAPRMEAPLPMPGHHAVLDLWRAHMDADHVRDLATPVNTACARQMGAAALTQTGVELAAQLSSGQSIDGGVDHFVGHVACRRVGKARLRVAACLLGRPLPVKQGQDRAPSNTIDIELGARTRSALTCEAKPAGRDANRRARQRACCARARG